jgi:dihydrolipoamide dehydrogenase
VARTVTVRVPDIGDFENVDVVEVLVRPGERVEREQSLIVLESDKASMEVPSPEAGVVVELAVAVNDRVSEGSAICTLRVEAAAEEEPAAAAARPREGAAREAAGGAGAAPPAGEPPEAETPERPAARAGPAPDGRADVVVLGAGPGGYTAAFRAADLGLRVVLVERGAELGGVCLHVGCIPSKTLLHMAAVLEEARALEEAGIAFGAPRFDLARVRKRKDEVVARMAGGLRTLAEQRRVRVVRGSGRFAGPHEIEVATGAGPERLAFAHAVVAAGSEPARLPGLPDDPRVLDSTSALEIDGPPGSLLVVGGGVIGLEMATVYAAFGTRVTIVELLDRLLLEADRDLVRPLEKRLRERCEAIHLATRVAAVEARDEGLHVRFEAEGREAPAAALFDRVLVAVGRTPNGGRVGAEAAGVRVDERGFLPVDARQRTNVAHVFAIGDVAGPPLLAHKATHQGKVAAEVIAGLPSAFDARAVPNVAYTDPELAWTGLTEAKAEAEGVAVRKAVFPWSASGRALGAGRPEGLTKLLFREDDSRLAGAGLVGPHAGDLVSEATLGIELGADAEDVARTIHPHPTLSETIAFAAELAEGTITDLLPPGARRRRGTAR